MRQPVITLLFNKQTNKKKTLLNWLSSRIISFQEYFLYKHYLIFIRETLFRKVFWRYVVNHFKVYYIKDTLSLLKYRCNKQNIRKRNFIWSNIPVFWLKTGIHQQMTIYIHLVIQWPGLCGPDKIPVSYVFCSNSEVITF